MSLRRTLLLAAMISVAPTAMVIAQTTPPTDTAPPSSTTSPRDTTMPTTPSQEAAPNTSSTDPSAASSPHQRDATRTASKQSMKDCIAKQQAENSGLSTADAKKACKAQMKGPG